MMHRKRKARKAAEVGRVWALLRALVQAHSSADLLCLETCTSAQTLMIDKPLEPNPKTLKP
jgi:hypothetical protein